MKNDSRKQKPYVYVSKRVLSCIVSVVIIVAIISINVYCDSEFTYLPVTTQENLIDDGTILMDNGTDKVIAGSSISGVYTAVYKWGNQNQYRQIAFFQKDNNNPTLYFNSNYIQFANPWIYDSNNGIYYRTSSTGINYGYSDNQIYVPIYDSFELARQAFSQFNDNPPEPPVNGKPLNYTLPSGNIAYLEIDSNFFNGVNLATIMPELSGVGSSDPWSLSSQFYAMTDDMLTNEASVYDLNGTRIVWNKSPNASTNLLGQTDHAVWESQGPYPNKTYFVICNPFYFFDNENNSSITIVANGIKNVYVQPLKTVVQQNGNVISYNTTVDGGTYEGEVTDDLGPIDWTDPDGGNTAPGTSTSNTPVTGINQFQQWLQGIMQQIISVFEPAHDAITTLASAVQNFSGWLKALYIWLPSPVLNLLTSAISLTIIIGVIKVFI